MRLKLDNETRKKLKIIKKAQKAFKKLSTKSDLSPQQKQSFKNSMAKGMQVCPTPAEAKIKEHLRLLGFQHNVVVYGFIPDFSSFHHKMIIEIDGKIHEKYEVRERDNDKNEAFKKYGWRVLRFTNIEVFQNLEKVLAIIRSELGFSSFQAKHERLPKLKHLGRKSKVQRDKEIEMRRAKQRILAKEDFMNYRSSRKFRPSR